MGCTCYFSSALQCLLHTPLLIEETSNCEFINEYQSVYRDFWHPEKSVSFLKFLELFRNKFKQFVPGFQHDAQEAILCIIDALDSKVTSFEMIQETVCSSEKVKSFEKMTMYIGVINGMEKWCGIQDYEDSKGVRHAAAATRTLFWSVPTVFILSLSTKTVVNLEEDLDLSPWIHQESPHKIKPAKYKLFATCIHTGSQHGGHYSAYTKYGDQWYFKDDDAVSRVDSYPKTCGHHVMFFKIID